MKFWGEKEDTTIPWWRRGSRKNQVEMASYALLVYAHKKDINGGLPVLRFLMTQRNSFGGFYSTQVSKIVDIHESKFNQNISKTK